MRTCRTSGVQSAADARRSGRAGGWHRQSRLCRGPSGVRTIGEVAQEEGGRALSQVVEEADAAAAIHDDGDVDFVPEPSFEVAGRDAEIAADIDDDGADGPAAHLLGDFFLGGEACETRVRSVGRASGGAGCRVAPGAPMAGRRMGATVSSWPRSTRRHSLASSIAARRRPQVIRARMTARSAVPKGLTNRAKPGVPARCWTVTASFLP